MEVLPEGYRRDGVSVITMPDIRWGRCDVKSVNLLPNVLAKQGAKEEGAIEALLIKGGKVQEGAGSNVFALNHDRLITPPKSTEILSGITRDVVLGLAKSMGCRVFEEELPLGVLQSSEEVFLTATTMEILPVVRVDGKPIGSGRPGEVQKRLYEGFLKLTRA